MEQHVILQVGWFAETATANMTSEWPQPIMHIHVTLQVTRCRKWFWTLRTFVWFLLKKHNEYFSMDIDEVIQIQSNFCILYISKNIFLFPMFLTNSHSFPIAHAQNRNVCYDHIYNERDIFLLWKHFFCYILNNKHNIVARNSTENTKNILRISPTWYKEACCK